MLRKENKTSYQFDYLKPLEMVFLRHYEKSRHPPKKHADTLCCKNIVS